MNSSTVTGSTDFSEDGRFSHASHVDDRNWSAKTYLAARPGPRLCGIHRFEHIADQFFQGRVMPPIFSPFWRRMGVP